MGKISLACLSVCFSPSGFTGGGDGGPGEAAGMFLSVRARHQCTMSYCGVQTEQWLHFTHHVCKVCNDATTLNIRAYNVVNDHWSALVVRALFWPFTSLEVSSTSGWLLEPKGWTSFPITPSGQRLATCQRWVPGVDKYYQTKLQLQQFL